MKPLHIIIMGVLIPMFMLGDTGGGGVSWFSAPKEEPNGWYWMYDDAEPGPPFDDPTLVPLPTFQDITADGNKLAPYGGTPFKYSLPDSFWYYGHWYDEADYLYISPDGWVSFDPNSELGFPDPPTVRPPFPVTDVPNAVIAPLWQDMNPTQTPDPSDVNRVYYKYLGMPTRLIVQWYDLQGNGNTHTYDFELMLDFGGQALLMIQGACGVVFSYHFIHFLYNDASHGWAADNGKTGIENETGLKGIYYEGTLTNGRVIRAGYKRVFTHDVKVTKFISPGTTVLRFTEIESIVEVSNVGQETEHFAVTLNIYDENNDDVLVYHQNISGFNLLPGEYDTLVGPCWTPGELFYPDTHTYRKVALTCLDRDECFHNDTLIEHSIVHCDGWLNVYNWNVADFPSAVAFRVWRLGTSYDIVGGTYVLGGRVWLGWRGEPPMYSDVPPRLEVWEAENGCGGIPDNAWTLGGYNYDGFAQPRVWHEIIFDQAIWCPAADPGNFWIAVANSLDPGAAILMGWVPYWGISPRPDPSACYNMDYDPSRGGYWQAEAGGPASNFNWGGYPDAPYHTHPIEALTHLGFRPMPEPPCYYDNAHDLACYEMLQPTEDYVEDGVAITPELAIANIGLEAEPDPGDFFAVEFIVVDKETSDTVFHEVSVVSDILDMGDTLYGTTAPWTPEGICRDVDLEAGTGPWVDYELIGLVCLGVVGPDETDHCPYNDTIRRDVTCLLTHDVGVIDIALDPGPSEPPDYYPPGTPIEITATVENFGYNMEHDIPVRCEIIDEGADPDTLVYNNVQLISALDWRGNPLDNPYIVEVTFPTWTTPSDNRFCIECRTEMEGDECPDDDFEVACSPPGLVEEARNAPRVFRLEVQGTMTEDHCQIQFAVPYSSWVKLEVFDIGGRWVKTLANDLCKPGYYNMTWDGKDAAGRKVATGIYLVRMQAKDFSATKKVVLY